MERYEPLRKIDTNLYCVDGDWENTPFRRRMTIVVLSNGDLVIHSAIRMSDQDLAELDKLGKVATIVAPNVYHGSDAQFYADRYPQAKVLVPYDAGGALRKYTRIDGTLEYDWPESYRTELVCEPILGTRFHEGAVFHKPTRTLILTDLVFNMQGSDFQGFMKTLMKWNNIVDRFGPSNLFKYYFMEDKDAVALSLQRIGEWDFERVIMNHGRILESDGKRRLKESFAPLLKDAGKRDRRESDRGSENEGSAAS